MDARRSPPSRRRGYTLVEVAVVVSLVSLVASMAVPYFGDARERARVAAAEAQIRLLQSEITSFYLLEGRYPESLAELDRAGIRDPWGRPYEYYPAEDPPRVEARVDRFAVVLNTDYDLYSVGEDGETDPRITSLSSTSDVIRANDGGYVGLAGEY